MSATVISILAGLGGMFGWGVYDFFAGVYSKQIGPFATYFWSQLAGLLFVGALFGLAFVPIELSLLTAALLPVAALFYSAGYLCFMHGFAIGNISIVAAIMNMWAVFTMLTAFIFMGQRLTGTQTVGAVMIILGAIMASLHWQDLTKSGSFRLSLGVKETLVGAFFFGTFWNISEIIAEEIGWLQTTLGIKLLIIVVLTGFAWLRGHTRGLTQTGARALAVIFAVGCVEAGAVALVNYGLTVGDAILITPIASALSVVTIALAFVLLKEKVSRLQQVGMLTAVCGIVLTGV